jgi:hypothetical protein
MIVKRRKIRTETPPKLDTWRHVAKQLAAAADGGDVNDVVVSLRLVLQLERIECRLRQSRLLEEPPHGLF